ncbi:hypothetical protein [Tenacibaculum sp. Ill]|uniref:hypothetical protein n=1 Tax=Tenacibaculum sp. Ill TaxID=3445935 RepID=UPI003F7A5D5C
MNLSKLKYRLKQALFFYCLLLVVGVYAQRYPVQVTQTIIPPYSTKLSDYATASDVKFRLNLLLTDVVANNKQVRLKLRIKGNGFDIQSTDFVAGASQVTLNGGVLQQFTNIDLAAYFQPNNLIGISPQQYNKPLPEGMYSFCWEVYDAYTNQQLNHPTAGCSNVYLLLNDPPFLNLPYKGDQIVAQDPMNIIFQWTPRHTNATNVSYEFELRELWDTQINPQAAFLASPNYYSETTYTTTLLYNIGKPTLLPNRRYGWRVKAKSTTGVSENSIFKNDGYSEIYYFTYTNACYPPTFVLSEVVAKDRVKLTWQGHPDHKKYHVQYKRADIPDAEWFEVYTYNTQAQISNLRAGKTYMFRVGGTCNELTDFEQSYSYSHMSQFTMPAKDEMGSSYNCGIIPEIQIDNNDPLKNIGINETFTAGDFPVTVKQVQGGNGTFTGVGYIVVPYLGDTKIAVTFDAISINTDYQLIEGVVKTTYDPTWGDMGDTNDWTQGGTGNSESTEVDFPVSDVQIDPNGDILIIGENGEVVELPGGEDIVITDSNGQVWAVDEEGNVTPQGTQAEGGASNPENTNGVNNNGQATAISAKGVIVTFKKASNSKYGFDGYESNYSATKDLYKKLGNDYYVPYKAVAKNDTETIVANLAITDSKIKPQDIVFKTKDGVAITKIDSTATSYTLQLKGVFDDAEIETQALVKQGTKYEVAGAFIQYQATPKNVKVVVVNTSNTSARTIKESLQNIYKQAMVNLTITEINDFKNDLEALTPNGTIQSGESGFAAQYTEQQRQINNKLKQHSQYQQDAYYLIVTDKTPSSTSEKGLMPLGRQFGYVYTTNCSTADCVALTAAHELGHGAFQLKHPFSSQSYQYAQKATNWLLDYKDGTKLPFVHWQTIHNPKLRIGVFDRDSEGQSVKTSLDISLSINETKYKCENGKCIKSEKGKYYYSYLTPSGKRVILSQDYTPIFYHGISNDKYTHIVPGALIGFEREIENPTGKEKYWSLLSSNGENFLGYNNDFIYEEKSFDDDDNSVVIGLPFGGSSGGASKWKNYKFTLQDLESFKEKDQKVLKVTSNEFKSLKLFSSKKPVKVKIYDNISKILGEEQISVTESELKILRGRYFEIPKITDFTTLIKGITTINHDEKPEVFLLIKIAEIQNRYPFLFEKYSKWFDQWNVYALTQENYLSVSANIISTVASFNYGVWERDNITKQSINNQFSSYRKWKDNLSSHNDDIYDFYKDFTISLRKYTDTQSEGNFECLNNLKDKTAKEIFECVELASNDELKLISQENRQEAIRIIAYEGNTSDFLRDREETVVQRLIKYVPSSFNRDEFISYLTNTTISLYTTSQYGTVTNFDTPLWQVLFDKIDDSKFLFPGDNRNAVMLQLLNHYYNSSQYEKDINKVVLDYQEKVLGQPVKAIDALHKQLYTFTNDYQNILRRGFTHFKGAAAPGGIFNDPDDFYFSIDAEIKGFNKIHLKQKLKWGFIPNTLHEDDFGPFDLSLMLNISKESLLNGFSLKDKEGRPQSVPLPAIMLYYASEVGNEQTKSDIIQSVIDVATLPIPATKLSQLGKVFYYADKISSVSSLMATANREDNPELSRFYNRLSIVTGVASIGDMVTPNKLLKEVISSKSLAKSADDIVEDVIKFTEEIESLPVGKLNAVEIGVSRRILEGNLEEFKALNLIDETKRIKIVNALDKLGKGLDFDISKHLVVLGENIDLTKLITFENKNKDGILDLVIHGDAERFMIDGEYVENITDIANWLKNNRSEVKEIRLLSCTDIAGAQNLVDHLGEGYKVYATDGFVRVHGDGSITNVPRNIGGESKWYELKSNANKVELPENARPRGPDASQLDDVDFLDEFIELSNRSKRETILASIEEGYYGKDIIKKFEKESDKEAFISDLLVFESTHNISKSNLLGNNISQLNEKIVEAWLQAKDYPTLRMDFKILKGLSESGSLDNFIEVVLKNSSVGLLESRLRLFGLNKCADAVKRRGDVFVNTLRLLENGDLEIGSFKDLVELYSFMRNGKKITKKEGINWLNYFRESLKKGEDFNGFEAHHIFPVELFQRKSFYTWYENYGYSLYSYNATNNVENLIMVEKFLTNPKSNISGVHAPHPNYSESIGEYFDKLFDDLSKKYDFKDKNQLIEAMEDFHDKLDELRYNIKQEIINKSIKGNIKIDELWKGNNFNNVKPN